VNLCECGCGREVPPSGSRNAARFPRRYFEAACRPRAERNRLREEGRGLALLGLAREELAGRPDLYRQVVADLENAQAALASVLSALTGRPRAV
jgi:hypothetical protein